MFISDPSFSNDRMFQQKTAREVFLYHITQLYRKVGMYLCRTEY